MAFEGSFVMLESVDSTNNYTANLIKQTDVAEGTVVMAQFQTAGRGQRGNSWSAEPNQSLLMSVVLRPKQLPATAQFGLNQFICLAIFRFLTEQMGVNAQVKWPNDILVEGKKIAGVLIENSLRGQYVEYSIAGIGLNLNQMGFPSGVIAVSLRQCTGMQYGAVEMARSLMEFVEQEYSLLNQPSLLENRYLKVLFGTDKFMRYREGEVEYNAQVVGLGPHGELRLRKDSGEEVLCQFKQVTLLGESIR